MAAEHKTKIKKADDPVFENLYGEAWDVTCTCGFEQRRSSEARANESVVEHLADPDAAAA